nr:MAG TPA: hypothetical protein [Caudoviricetes sp.]
MTTNSCIYFTTKMHHKQYNIVISPIILIIIIYLTLIICSFL